MLCVEICQVFIAQLLRPAIDRISFRLRARILRREGNTLSANDGRALGSIKGDEVTLIVVQIAAQIDTEIWIVVKRFNQVWKVAAIFEMEQSASRLGPLRDRIDAHDEADAGNQMHEEIARETLAVVAEAAPAKEPLRAKRAFRCVPKKGVPINRLLAGIWWNGIDPSAAW